MSPPWVWTVTRPRGLKRWTKKWTIIWRKWIHKGNYFCIQLSRFCSMFKRGSISIPLAYFLSLNPKKHLNLLFFDNLTVSPFFEAKEFCFSLGWLIFQNINGFTKLSCIKYFKNVKCSNIYLFRICFLTDLSNSTWCCHFFYARRYSRKSFWTRFKNTRGRHHAKNVFAKDFRMVLFCRWVLRI